MLFHPPLHIFLPPPQSIRPHFMFPIPPFLPESIDLTAFQNLPFTNY